MVAVHSTVEYQVVEAAAVAAAAAKAVAGEPAAAVGTVDPLEVGLGVQCLEEHLGSFVQGEAS